MALVYFPNVDWKVMGLNPIGRVELFSPDPPSWGTVDAEIKGPHGGSPARAIKGSLFFLSL